jgi:hypothetical protein
MTLFGCLYEIIVKIGDMSIQRQGDRRSPLRFSFFFLITMRARCGFIRDTTFIVFSEIIGTGVDTCTNPARRREPRTPTVIPVSN